MTGAMQLYSAAAASPNVENFVCPGRVVSRAEMRDVFLEWAAANPERLGEPARRGREVSLPVIRQEPTMTMMCRRIGVLVLTSLLLTACGSNAGRSLAIGAAVGAAGHGRRNPRR
jgi:hypothetical protein